MDNIKFNSEFIEFIKAAKTPFHAVDHIQTVLESNRFIRLFESVPWDIKEGRYYVTRGDSSIIAFTIGKADPIDTGFRMVCAHTDSPCLKVKPNSEIINNNCLQIAVEMYGGFPFASWFDKELSLAGIVIYSSDDKKIKKTLIDFHKPIGFIPSIAIHLERNINKDKVINPQDELIPIISNISDENKTDLKKLIIEHLNEKIPSIKINSILAHELNFYDANPPSLLGINNDFIASPRIDNLISCYASFKSLIKTKMDSNSIMFFADNEEIGSLTRTGAKGNFFTSVLSRILKTQEEFAQTIEKSMMLSIDCAHGLNPNYKSKTDSNHIPLLNKGIVIKSNSSFRYASNFETIGVFKNICEDINIPVQYFVMRNDMESGSTIGSSIASSLGIRTIDIGIPILGMHSIRELCGSKDGFYLFQLLKHYYELDKIPFDLAFM
ncbi:MAG: M18 family aminopeptidase [Desulfobacterales bacterium]|nr:M18 family aminopeptidase [Desulfobacterales bacterium]